MITFKKTFLVITWILIFHLGRSEAEELCARAEKLLRVTEEIRNLDLKEPFKCSVLTKNQYQTLMQKLLKEEVTIEKLGYRELLFKLFGLIPLDYNYTSCYFKQQSEYAGAFYDPKDHTIVLPDFKVVSDDILVHELVHALQESNFKIYKRAQGKNSTSDSDLGWAALIEGDAVVVQELFIENTGYVFELADSEANSNDNCSTPENIRELELFPYYYGKLLALKLLNQESFSEIDRLYKQLYMPNSKEVMHRKLLPAQSDSQTVKINLSKLEEMLASKFPDEYSISDSLGQYFIRLFLGISNSPAVSLRAAKGLTTDRLLYFKADLPTVVWQSEWETIEDASEFYYAFVVHLNKILDARLDFEARAIQFENVDGSRWYLERETKKIILGYFSN